MSSDENAKTAKIPLEGKGCMSVTLGWHYHFSNPPRNNLQKTHSKIPNVSCTASKQLKSEFLQQVSDVFKWCLSLGLYQDIRKIKLDPRFHWHTLYSKRNTTFETLTPSYSVNSSYAQLRGLTIHVHGNREPEPGLHWTWIHSCECPWPWATDLVSRVTGKTGLRKVAFLLRKSVESSWSMCCHFCDHNTGSSMSKY